MQIFKVTITAHGYEGADFHKEILVHGSTKEEIAEKFDKIERSDMYESIWFNEWCTNTRIAVEEHWPLTPIDLGSALFSALNEMSHEKPHEAAKHIMNGGDLDDLA